VLDAIRDTNLGDIVGSTFVGRYRWLDRDKGEIAPSVTGSAYVTAQATLRLDPNDPFCWGIRQ
jgi:4-hydroxyproline epimerase